MTPVMGKGCYWHFLAKLSFLQDQICSNLQITMHKTALKNPNQYKVMRVFVWPTSPDFYDVDASMI